MQAINCKIKSVEKLNDFLFRVFLTPEKSVYYKAGQYVSIVMSELSK